MIDSGIYTSHTDFEDRAFWSTTFPSNSSSTDGLGHGTTCAGIVEGNRYGVAKKVRVFAVKTVRSNGDGKISDIIKGIEFAINSHLKNTSLAKVDPNRKFKGSVINMSLGVDKSPALDFAANLAVDAGVHVVVAAGNENDEETYSCNWFYG
jgi:cerevisin